LGERGFVQAAVYRGEASDESGAALVLAQNPAEVPASGNARWLLLADTDGVAQRLADRLQQMGQRCLIVESAAASEALPAWLIEADLPGRTVVDLRSVHTHLAEADDTTALSAKLQTAVSALVALVGTLAECERTYLPRLALVTHGSQCTSGEPAALVQVPLWSIARAAAIEHPRMPVLAIDLDLGPVDSQIEALAMELLHGNAEPQVALRVGGRLVPRLHRLDDSGADRLQLPSDHAFALQIRHRGSLDGVEVHPIVPQAPADTEVQIRPIAAGLNFRDLLNVLGAIDGVPLGLECSGIISAVGAQVRDFALGDAVFAAGLGSWGSHFNTPASLVSPKPAQLRHEQAAALPIAYLTAHYALRHIAHLQAQQRVLIHSAAGGVGLAAVHLALAAGAEVFATAGSAAKRDYLRSLGVAHVFDSRSLQFADQLPLECPAGLDVVLNCFTGEFIPKSLDLLGANGHFIELGKREIWSHSRVAQRRPDVRYQVIELAQTMKSDPDSLAPMLQQLVGEINCGKLPPLPIRAFALSQVVPALRFMQNGRQTGKIVLKAPTRFHAAGGSWLIAGGLGGLGLELAEWLVERGASNLILIGRRALQDPDRGRIERMRSLAVQVLVQSCDVADSAQLAATVADAVARLGPLRGVFHLAGILEDAPLRQLEWYRFASVYRPKILGAWNLHRLTRDMPLDCFVLFSSWTALLGSPGQANHASANAFLDALAHYRRSQGLAGQSINWGGWREIGSAARPERLAHLARQGIGSLAPGEGLKALSQVLDSDLIQVGVSPFDAATWRTTTLSESAKRCLDAMVSTEPVRAQEPRATTSIPLREALQQTASGAARRQLIEACIQRHLARVLRTSSAPFGAHQSFKSLGLDSLTALELRNALEVDAGQALPASLVYNHSTIATLAAELAARMDVSLQNESGALTGSTSSQINAGDHELDALLGALRELPPEEAQRLLATHSTAEPDR
jgi:NADPH:quinone reductase-like Zn-dependent oxidoreductase/NADP-dependent 3-hydroxy acid dehydrogenase YdfG/acyl carrier protein